MFSRDWIKRNLDVVESHIMNEARDPDSVLGLYTDDIVQAFPSRGLVFNSKASIADNYRKIFSSMENVELEPLERFATRDRVFDDMIVRFTLISDGLEGLDIPIGSRVQLRLVHIFHMRGGLIAREIVHEHYSII